MAYRRRFTTPSAGSFNITTALQTPEFQQYLLQQAGQEPEKKKASFFDRLFRLMDTFSWTDEAYDAKRLGLSGGQALGRYLMDIPKTLNVLNPWATTEDLQKDLGKGMEYAKLQGVSNPGLSGFLMDVLDPSLIIGGVVKGAVGAGSKGLSSVGKEFVEKGAKEITENIAKEGAESAGRKLTEYVGKELGENAAKTAATRLATGEGVQSILTDVAKTFGKETMAQVTEPGLRIAGKMAIPGKNAGRIGRFIENPLIGGAEVGWAGLGRLPGGSVAQDMGTRALEPLRELFSFGRQADKAGVKELFQKIRLAPRVAETKANQEVLGELGQAILEGTLPDVPSDTLVELTGGSFDRTVKGLLDRAIKTGDMTKAEVKTVKGLLASKFGKGATLDNLKLLEPTSEKTAKILKKAQLKAFEADSLKNAAQDLADTYLKKTYSGDALTKLQDFMKASRNAILDDNFDEVAYKGQIDELMDMVKTVKAGEWTPGQMQAHTEWLDALKVNASMNNIWRDLGESSMGLSYFPRRIGGEEAVSDVGEARKYLTSLEAEKAGKEVLRDEESILGALYEARKYQSQKIMEHSAYTDLVSQIKEGLTPDVGRYFQGKPSSEALEGLEKAGFVKATGKAKKIRMFNGVYMKQEVWDVINRTDAIFGSPQTSTKFGQMLEKLSGIWRGMQTGAKTPIKVGTWNFPLFPAFTTRNKVNNVLESMVRGEMGFADVLKYQKDTMDVLKYLQWSIDPTKPADEVAKLGKKLVDGIKIKDWVDEMNTAGIRSGDSFIDEIGVMLRGDEEGMLERVRRMVQGNEEKVKEIREILSRRMPKEKATQLKEGVEYLTDEEIAKRISKIVTQNDINRIAEDQDRMALYMFRRAKKGETATEARNMVARVLFDYSELTPFERNTLRPLTGFYTWSSKNLQGYAKMLSENPNRLKLYTKVFEAIKDRPTDLSQEEYDALPDWMKESLAIYINRSGNQAGFLTGLGSSLDAISGTIGRTPKDTGMNLLGMMNPIFSLPLQATLDRNFFKDKAISEDTTGYQYANLPEPIKELLGVRQEQYMTGDGEIKSTWKMDPWKKFWLEGIVGRLATTTGKAANLAAGESDPVSILNFVTGVKYQQRDLDWEIERHRRDLQEELDKQLVEAGLATPKSGVYMNKSAYLNYPSLKGSLKSEFGYNPKEQSVSDKLKASEEKSKDQAYIEQLINQVQTN